jgi:hypothetical protein
MIEGEVERVSLTGGRQIAVVFWQRTAQKMADFPAMANLFGNGEPLGVLRDSRIIRDRENGGIRVAKRRAIPGIGTKEEAGGIIARFR